MRTDEEQGVWTELRGKWSVSALTHSSMSANAFQYVARTSEGEEGAVVAGYPFWDEYSFEASVKPQKRATLGLYFYYHDENNYFRFEWDPEPPDGPGGEKRLVRVYDGERTVVARQPGGFRLDQWYALCCRVSAQRARVFIDRNLVFEHRDDRLTSGMVGLYVGEKARTFFDDVFVRSHRYFEDKFVDGLASAWDTMQGRWRHIPIGSTDGDDAQAEGVLHVDARVVEARAAVGSTRWKDYVFETEIHPDERGRAGVLLYYQDETRFYEASFVRETDAAERWTLTRVLDDERTVLDERSIARKPGSRRVRAVIREGVISVLVGGAETLQAVDTQLRSGRPGLTAADGASVSFGPVSVDWPLEAPPLLTLNEVFEQEKSMANWSSIENAWRHVASKGLLIHEANYPGDAKIEVRVTNAGPGRAEMGLVLSATDDDADSGYTLRLQSHEGKLTLGFLRLGRPMSTPVWNVLTGEKSVEPVVAVEGEVYRIALRRRHGLLVGSVNQRPVIAQRDEEPLGGDRLGWYDRRSTNNSKKALLADLITVDSPNVQQYLFRRAHVDWRVVGGIWEVTSRWQCDPRWTFFSGRSSAKLAAIWYKPSLEGVTTLDYYIGPKMDRDRGNRYEYAADFNCTLAADGVDLTSGYTFMFGGFGNTKTVLMRKSRVVAEGRWPVTQSYMRTGEPAVIPSAKLNIHRQWFRVKAQKDGNRLRMWIDDELVIDYRDPDPLTGDRAAIWTWHNGIMVARVTASADRIGLPEPPDVFVPAQCRCVYDEPELVRR
jgi:hypothetical protein